MLTLVFIPPPFTVLPLASVGSFPPQGLAICECWLSGSCEGQPRRDMWATDCHPWGWEAGLIDFKPGCMTRIRTQWLDYQGTKDKFTTGCGHLVEPPQHGALYSECIKAGSTTTNCGSNSPDRPLDKRFLRSNFTRVGDRCNFYICQ